MNVPFIDLAAHHAPLRQELDKAVAGVIDGSEFVGGPGIERFEEAFAHYCEASDAVGVGSGTDALWLTLVAAGVGVGDEVVTVPNTFIATVAAISRTGATPVFVDVDPETYTMDPTALEGVITRRTRAIIPVHLFGQPADMDPILAVAARHGLTVIEDACQAHGARYRGRKVGALGHAGCFSFYPGKNLGAFGDAGAVVSNCSVLAERVRLLRDHGRTHKNRHVVVGANSRMDGLQAAVLLVKLRRLDVANLARQRLARWYDAALEGLDAVVRPRVADYASSVYHVYAIQVADRDRVKVELARRGIDCGVHYPIPVHRQPAYQMLGLAAGSFPVAEGLAEIELSLPMFPELTPPQLAWVVSELRTAVEDGVLAA